MAKRAHVIDLADSNQLVAFSSNPSKLEEDIFYQRSSLVVIDEIQLLPHLLNDVQRLIERNSIFYGNSFEQFIWMELRAYLSYTRTKLQLAYWRSQ